LHAAKLQCLDCPLGAPHSRRDDRDPQSTGETQPNHGALRRRQGVEQVPEILRPFSSGDCRFGIRVRQLEYRRAAPCVTFLLVCLPEPRRCAGRGAMEAMHGVGGDSEQPVPDWNAPLLIARQRLERLQKRLGRNIFSLRAVVKPAHGKGEDTIHVALVEHAKCFGVGCGSMRAYRACHQFGITQ
jgi:hypothetical protein